VQHVSTHGGSRFFESRHWRDELHDATRRYRAAHGTLGRFETDDEHEARVIAEMRGSREAIETRLGRPVEFLCWPCGDYTPRLQQLAIDTCGYLATVNVEKVGNRPGDDPAELRRIGFGQDYIGPRRSDLVFMNFVGSLNYHRGVRSAYPVAPLARRLMRIAGFVDRARGRATAAS